MRLAFPKSKGFREICKRVFQKCFKGTKGPRASGFQGIEGFPLLAGAFKKFGVSKIPRVSGKIYKI